MVWKGGNGDLLSTALLLEVPPEYLSHNQQRCARPGGITMPAELLEDVIESLDRLGWRFTNLQYLGPGLHWSASAQETTTLGSLKVEGKDHRAALANLVKAAKAQPSKNQRHAIFEKAANSKNQQHVDRHMRRRGKGSKPSVVAKAGSPGADPVRREPSIPRRPPVDKNPTTRLRPPGDLAFQLGVSPRRVREIARKIGIVTEAYSANEVIHIINEMNRPGSN